MLKLELNVNRGWIATATKRILRRTIVDSGIFSGTCFRNSSRRIPSEIRLEGSAEVFLSLLGIYSELSLGIHSKNFL